MPRKANYADSSGYVASIDRTNVQRICHSKHPLASPVLALSSSCSVYGMYPKSLPMETLPSAAASTISDAMLVSVVH